MKTFRNLLFIMTDQQRPDTMAAYGNTQIRTPNLNRLAAESTVFQRCYVTQPVCTPSRGSIMTGLYPHNHGSIENNTPLKPEAPTLPELLADGGFCASYIGKWHLGNEVIKQHGFDEWISTEDNYFEYYTDKAFLRIRSDYDQFLRSQGFLPDVDSDEFDHFSREFETRLPQHISKPAFSAIEASRFLRRHRNDRFLLYVSFLEPHPPYYSSFDDLYPRGEVTLPPLFHDSIPDNVPLKYRYNMFFHRDVGRHFPMKDESAWRKLIARYWGAVSLVDYYVGQILRELDVCGLSDQTLVIFTSDHGDMMGDYRMLQKYVMYESAVRVPLLMRLGDRTRPASVSEPVSQIDLVPTVAALLGRPVDSMVDGRQFKQVDDPSDRRDVFVEWNGAEGEDKWFKAHRSGDMKDEIDRVYGAAVRTVVTPDLWKMSVTSAGENELYHLEADPCERHNLFYDPAQLHTRNSLAGKLRRWQSETKDGASLRFEGLGDDEMEARRHFPE